MPGPSASSCLCRIEAVVLSLTVIVSRFEAVINCVRANEGVTAMKPMSSSFPIAQFDFLA